MARPAGLSQEVHRFPHRARSATDGHSDDSLEGDLRETASPGGMGCCHTAPDQRAGSSGGRAKAGRTVGSNRVIAEMPLPLRVRTKRPVAWLVPSGARR